MCYKWRQAKNNSQVFLFFNPNKEIIIITIIFQNLKALYNLKKNIQCTNASTRTVLNKVNTVPTVHKSSNMIFELSRHSHWSQFCWKESWHNMSPLYLCVQCLYISSLISPQAFWIKVQDNLCHQFCSQSTCIPLPHSVQLHKVATTVHCTASQHTYHCTVYSITKYPPLH